VNRSERSVSRRGVLIASLCANSIAAVAQPLPAVDHHQHLFSAAIVELRAHESDDAPQVLLARDVMAQLDAVGIRRAVVMSAAYEFGSPTRVVGDEYASVQQENDWTSAQIAPYSDRLVGFCSLNPLKPYALDEITRCSHDPNLQRGIFLHFGSADVQLDDAAHVAQLRRVFRAANDHGMAIVADFRAAHAGSTSYGVAQARIFLEQLLPETPDVSVQIAHLSGDGGAGGMAVDSAFAILADAVAARDPRAARLWFDLTSVVSTTLAPVTATLVAQRIRQIGVDRVVFGSDLLRADDSPCAGWWEFLRLPLSTAELRTIATNIMPYLPRISRMAL
jgi:uncharacterized protein